MNGSLRIVPVSDEAGLAAVAQLASEVWPRAYERILSPEQTAYMMKMMYDRKVLAGELAEGVCFDLLCRDGEPLGFVSYGPYQGEPGTAKLHKVYLKFTEHGKGCGSMLMRYAMRRCRELGFRRIVLNVNKFNTGAQEVYKHLGFKVAAAVRNDIGNGFFMDDYVMEHGL